MIQFDLPKKGSSIIKVIGVGGGGSNAVNYMYGQQIEGVDFIICNTDAKAIDQSKIPNKIQLGPFLTSGLGAGANPEVGKKATEESIDEIKKILEVNTKMAFITVGMGGGTGTGGGPIIAKVCKELKILTVGIVTTPFSWEGPKRLLQAEEGIKALKPYVDTLLVISNEKLRHQYGNLKLRDAFSRADNVLATAAKCITDIINSKGLIIVDFADVCTVMQNGGVAILGKGEADGEKRAQKAIEEALSSPLLNDNEIKGAKWILININSAEGEDEHTMDELDVIQTYLKMQAGELSDVIMGTGYDNTLGKKISITLIATGFDSASPFHNQANVGKKEEDKQKIVVTLGQEKRETRNYISNGELSDEYKPKLQGNINTPFYNSPQNDQAEDNYAKVPLQYGSPQPSTNFTYVNGKLTETKPSQSHFNLDPQLLINTNEGQDFGFSVSEKPFNDNGNENQAPYRIEVTKNGQPNHFDTKWPPVNGDKASDLSNTSSYEKGQIKQDFNNSDFNNKKDEEKWKYQQRIDMLRRMSFNLHNLNQEYDDVPALVRQQMDVTGKQSLSGPEGFYSKIEVSKDENGNNGQLSTLNTFTEGNRLD